MRTPRPGDVLRSEDEGVGYVIGHPAVLPEVMAALLRDQYGGDWKADDPEVVSAARCLVPQVWHSCRKAYREAHYLDDDVDYWAQDGDGARSIEVVWYPHDVYELGDRIVEHREQREGST